MGDVDKEEERGWILIAVLPVAKSRLLSQCAAQADEQSRSSRRNR